MSNGTVDKKTFVIVGVGIAVAATLILTSVFKNDDKKSVVAPEVIVQNKNLSEDEQMKLKPVAELINAVVDRFEDTISKERAKNNSKILIKEFIDETNKENKEKKLAVVESWGSFVENMTAEKLKEWNKKQEEQFAIELKKLTEEKEIKNIPVEEIAQNNPLYILQEKKIIQRELFEQWLLKTKTEDLTIDPNKAIEVKDETKEKEVTPLAVIPVPDIKEVKEDDKKDLKGKDIEKENKESQALKENLEKAQATAKELDKKKLELNEELEKNTKSLKDIEEEIKKTKAELVKIDKELKDSSGANNVSSQK